MVRQRPGKQTYPSVAQRAREQSQRPFHKQRRLPPKFSDLFIKKNASQHSEQHSNENISLFHTGAKSEKMFSHTQSSRELRKPLGVSSNLTNSGSASGSHGSFNDTFDKLLGNPRAMRSPLMYQCSSTSESHLEASGLLFKSLLSAGSSWMTNRSVGCGTKEGSQSKPLALQNNNLIIPKSPEVFCKTKLPELSQVQDVSSELFTSRDQLVGINESRASRDRSQDRTGRRGLRQGAQRKVPVHKQKIKSAKGNKNTVSHKAGKGTQAGSRRMALPCQPPVIEQVQPSPVVQRFLRSLRIGSPSVKCTSPVPSLLTPKQALEFPPSGQRAQSKSSQQSSKSSVNSDIHTSTPTDRSKFQTVFMKGSKWSVQASPSLETAISPVPRVEGAMSTDRSSVFGSPTPLEVRRSASLLGASPNLGSKYETCMSFKNSGKSCENNDNSTSTKEFVTGNTFGESEHYEKPTSFYNCFKKITSGPFKGAMIPALSYESPPIPAGQDAASPHPGSPEKIRLGDSSIIVGKKKTKGKKNVKRLGSKDKGNGSRWTTSSSSSELTKKASPMVTRRKAKIQGQLSNKSSTLRMSFVHNKVSPTHSSSDSVSTLNESNRNDKENSSKRSKTLHRQETEPVLDGERTVGESVVCLSVLSDKSLQVNSVASIFSGREQSPVFKARQTRGMQRQSAGLPSVSDGNSWFFPPPTRKSARLLLKEASHNQSHNDVIRRSARLSLRGHGHAKPNNNQYKKLSNAQVLQTIDETNCKWREVSVASSITSSNCSSIINFRTRKKRRADELVYYREASSPSIISLSPSSCQDYMPTKRLQLPSDNTHEWLETSDRLFDPAAEASQRGSHAGVLATKSHGVEYLGCGGDSGQWECLVPPSPIPAKPGKGWMRSIAGLANNRVSLATGDQTGSLLHQVSGISSRKVSGLRMSSIPPGFEPSEPQPGDSMRGESRRRSFLQISRHEKHQDPTALSDPRQQVLQICSQEEPLPITHCFTESRLACCKKIGEGVYGEVFMTRPNPTTLEGSTVLKVMPIEGTIQVNGEPQKKFGEILSEIVISRELSDLRKSGREKSRTENFVHMLSSWCVEGQYLPDLLHMWDIFREEKGSENDRPDFFPDSQLYVVLEFGHGGHELANYTFINARNAQAVFFQIAYSLAVAEEALEFEHRDLHWGNILIAPTSQSDIDYKLSGSKFSLKTHGFKATVIDFTLSRIKLPHCLVFNNLAEDPSLFTSEGDYQFEIYRQMRNTNKNDWEKFTPYNNVLWLHYLLDKMTSECYFKHTKSKLHRSHHTQLLRLRDTMLEYESATHFVLSRESQL